MSLTKEMKYMTVSDNDELEELSNRLTVDLRTHIRYLNDYPLLSDEWNKMAKGLGRIGNICEMEAKMPKKNENETLWDGEEVALRFILEDGKLNLCLRELVKYQEFMEEVASGREQDLSRDRESLEAFETGMVLLLKNAWLHVEAMQTTDIPLLVEYVARVLEFSSTFPDIVGRKKFRRSSELMIVYFLMGLMKWIDEVGETRVMPLLVQHRIFNKLVLHVRQWGNKFQQEDLVAAAETLSMICDTEDFQANAESYLETEADKTEVLHLKDDYLEQAIEEEGSKRKFRPLLDFMRDCERDIGQRARK